jgi:ABC-type multidrug transport system ATPase subunit
MTVRGNKKVADKKLLTNVWGEVPKKEITAIMGPSGSGKTSLLNILSGRMRSRGKLIIESDIRLDNFPVDPTKLAVRKLIAFVGQDDSLMATATVREAIRFSAKLRLPRATTNDELDTIVSAQNIKNVTLCISLEHVILILSL